MVKHVYADAGEKKFLFPWAGENEITLNISYEAPFMISEQGNIGVSSSVFFFSLLYTNEGGEYILKSKKAKRKRGGVVVNLAYSADMGLGTVREVSEIFISFFYIFTIIYPRKIKTKQPRLKNGNQAMTISCQCTFKLP